MANLIIKPASASDSLKLQDGAGADIVTVSTNKVTYGKGISEEAVTVTQGSGTVTLDLAQGNFFEFTLTENVQVGHFQTLPLLEQHLHGLSKLLSTHQVLRQLHTQLGLNGQEEQIM